MRGQVVGGQRVRANAGFTVLELLIAAAMLSVLLGLLASLLHTTRRAYDTNEALSFEQQAAEAATELLRYELSLAGYRGTDAGYTGRTFGAPPLEVSPARDRVTVRYFEDRFQTSPKLNEIVFKLKADRTALVRKAGNGTFQEAARGIHDFEVSEFRLRDSSTSASLPNLDDLAGLTVRLTLADGTQRYVPVTFENDLSAL